MATAQFPVEWQALHVFMPPPGFDRFLVESVVPAIANAAGSSPAKWFFIRFGEGGHHLRIRVRGLDGAALDGLRERLARDVAHVLEADTGSRDADQPPPLAAAMISGTDFHAEGTVRAFPYEPEVQRYGGADALPICETLFCSSSQLATRVIGGSLADVSRRMTQALDLMLAVPVCLAKDGPDAFAFFASYAVLWRTALGKQAAQIGDTPTTLQRPAIEKRLQQLAALKGEEAGSRTVSGIWLRQLGWALDRFGALAGEGRLISPIDNKAAAPAERFAEAVLSIFVSQMHMMNNRLGLSPLDELRLASALGALKDGG